MHFQTVAPKWVKWIFNMKLELNVLLWRNRMETRWASSLPVGLEKVFRHAVVPEVSLCEAHCVSAQFRGEWKFSCSFCGAVSSDPLVLKTRHLSCGNFNLAVLPHLIGRDAGTRFHRLAELGWCWFDGLIIFLCLRQLKHRRSHFASCKCEAGAELCCWEKLIKQLTKSSGGDRKLVPDEPKPIIALLVLKWNWLKNPAERRFMGGLKKPMCVVVLRYLLRDVWKPKTSAPSSQRNHRGRIIPSIEWLSDH